MLDWLLNDSAILYSLIGFVIAIGLSIAFLPWLASTLPVDYFCEEREQPVATKRSAWKYPKAILRNAIGIILIILGIAMLVLPGQGVLTIVAGIALTDFPGKRKLELWLIRKPKFSALLNWLRAKRGKPPVQVPEEEQ